MCPVHTLLTSPKLGGGEKGILHEALLIITIENISEKQFELLGFVTSACCLSKSVVGDMKAKFKNWTIGGELPDYTKMIEKVTSIVIEKLIHSAESIQTDAIIGFRLVTTEVATCAAELIAYGTAVKYKKIS